MLGGKPLLIEKPLPEIGPLHACYLSQRFEPSPLAWLDRRTESGGGIVLHTGVHSFDLLRVLTGCEVTRVWCRTVQIITRETEDRFVLTCQLSNPSLLAAIAGSRAMGGRVGLLELAGARGHLLADHVHGCHGGTRHGHTSYRCLLNRRTTRRNGA